MPASASTRIRSPVLIRFVPVTGADDGGQAVLAGDDRRVAHDAADVEDGGGDRAEDGRPARGGRGRDEDLALLELVELGRVEDHARAALGDAGRAGDPGQRRPRRRRRTTATPGRARW